MDASIERIIKLKLTYLEARKQVHERRKEAYKTIYGRKIYLPHHLPLRQAILKAWIARKAYMALLYPQEGTKWVKHHKRIDVLRKLPIPSVDGIPDGFISVEEFSRKYPRLEDSFHVKERVLEYIRRSLWKKCLKRDGKIYINESEWFEMFCWFSEEFLLLCEGVPSATMMKALGRFSKGRVDTYLSRKIKKELPCYYLPQLMTMNKEEGREFLKQKYSKYYYEKHENLYWNFEELSPDYEFLYRL